MSCKDVMCQLGLNTKADAMNWIRKNHPDKGGEVSSGLFTKVVDCKNAGS